MKPLRWRRLTAGEAALADEMFGAGLDPGRVRLLALPVWNRAFVAGPRLMIWPAFAAWTDFSAAPLETQAVFVHELTHVWQAQKGGRFYLPLARHPFCRYRYEIVPGRPFRRYGLEQQAEIVRHIFMAEHGASIACPPRSLLPF